MTTARLPALLGASLLAGVFLYATARLLQREGEPASPGEAGGRVTVRLAHYLVYESHRPYFESVARDYERLHPHVRVEIADVPIRVWPTWRKTQLDAPDPPDMVQLGQGFTDEQMALYLLPLGEAVARPNPYNAGTDLADVSWRETFVDGLRGSGDSSETFNYRLLEYYGVPTYANTVRLFCNLDLLEKITGSRNVPEDFEDFIALGEKIEDYARRHRLPITALAGAEEYARLLFTQLFQQQSQRVTRTFDLERNLTQSDREAAIAFLRGDWRPDTGPVRSAWAAWRTLGRLYQPGFLGAMRDDAGFLFKQQRAVMIVSGSWDAFHLLTDNPFEVSVLPLPNPPVATSDGRLGPLSESALLPSGSFGIMRRSRHPEIALDFLRFLTSRQINQRFADVCLRIPVVRGAHPPPEIAAFAPREDGYESGFSPYFQNFGRRAVYRVMQTTLDRLVAPSGSVEAFLADLETPFRAALRDDVQAFARDSARTFQRTDSMLVALQALAVREPEAAHRYWRLSENQSLGESDHHQALHALAWANP